jgi:hypothetical protein
MALLTQNVRFENVTSTTSYSELNSISVLNSSTDDLAIKIVSNSSVMYLGEGESVTISASSGFVLPVITLESMGAVNCQVILT